MVPKRVYNVYNKIKLQGRKVIHFDKFNKQNFYFIIQTTRLECGHNLVRALNMVCGHIAVTKPDLGIVKEQKLWS